MKAAASALQSLHTHQHIPPAQGAGAEGGGGHRGKLSAADLRKGGGGRRALELWVQAHIAGAATLTLAHRAQEASRLLSCAAAQLPLLLGLTCQGNGGEGGEGGKEVWKDIVLPIVETLCVLAAQAACSRASTHLTRSLDAGGYGGILWGVQVVALAGTSPSLLYPAVGAGVEMVVGGDMVDMGVDTVEGDWMGGVKSVSVGALCPYSVRNVWLKAVMACRGSGGGGPGVGDVEAVEHCLNVWYSCLAAANAATTAVAEMRESSRSVVERRGVGVASAVMVWWYVRVLRSAAPHRGASTARERMLANVASHYACPCAQQGVQGGGVLNVWCMRVLVALGRDAVLSLLACQPGPASGGAQEEEEEVGWKFEEEMGAGEMGGRGDLAQLSSMMQHVCDTAPNLFAHDTSSTASTHVNTHEAAAHEAAAHEAAAAAAELCYWTSRLVVITSSTFTTTAPTADAATASSCSSFSCSSAGQKSLEALRQGVASVRHCLGYSHVDAGAAAMEGSAAQEQRGSVSSDIMALVQMLLSEVADEKQGDEERGVRPEKEMEGWGDALDVAEQVIVWWMCRSYVWARLLELVLDVLQRSHNNHKVIPHHLHKNLCAYLGTVVFLMTLYARSHAVSWTGTVAAEACAAAAAAECVCVCRGVGEYAQEELADLEHLGAVGFGRLLTLY